MADKAVEDDVDGEVKEELKRPDSKLDSRVQVGCYACATLFIGRMSQTDIHCRYESSSDQVYVRVTPYITCRGYK